MRNEYDLMHYELKVTRGSRTNTPWLFLEEISRHGKIISGARLMRLYEHESDLDRGRFKRYTDEAQQYATDLEIAWGVANFDDDSAFPSMAGSVKKLVEWIATHGTGDWSIDFHTKDMSSAYLSVPFVFSFAEAVDGVLFKFVSKN